MKLIRVLMACTFFSISLLASGTSGETDIASQIEEQSIEKQFVIIKSTRDYNEALKTAQLASKSLGITLDLRGLTENKESGLTLSKAICEKEEGGDALGWPCYYARGRHDDGTFISIEYSSAFQGFKKGYYIVVVASHPNGDKEIIASLKKAKTQFPDAYAKTTKVYMGCMH